MKPMREARTPSGRRRSLKPPVRAPQEAICVSCGCTDWCACDSGCYWLELNERRRRGVCSSCPGARKRFVAGNQDLTDRALRAILDRVVTAEAFALP
jgi:hypothetical protein